MAQIRTEINILTAVLSAASGVSATSNEVARLDTTQYSGSITCYFEVIAETSVSLTSNITLRRNGTSTNDATCTIPTLTTAYTRIRSASFTPPAGATEYVVFIDAAVGATKNVKAARIVIIQNSTSLKQTETQIEIGDTQTFTATTDTALTRPKYFNYDSSKWDGTLSVFFEITGKSDSTKNTFTYTLQVADGTGDGFTGWSNVTNGAITLTATTATRSRTSTALTLTNGRNYRVVVKSSSTKNTGTIYSAKLIIQQDGRLVTGQQTDTVGGVFNVQGSGGATEAQGQSFTAASSYTLSGIRLFIRKAAAPTDNVYLEIRSGSITGTLLGTSDNINGAALSTTAAWVVFNFASPVSLTSGTVYYLRLHRSGTRDTTNFFTWLGSAGASFTGGLYTLASSVWGAESGSLDAAFQTLDNGQLTKLEPQYLIVNTLLGSGTALQNTDTYFDPAEWSGVVNTYRHQLEAANGATSDAKLQSDPNGTPADVSGSTVTDPDNAGRSAAMTMPSTAKEIDVIATTNNNDLYASRILVQVVVASFINRGEFFFPLAGR